MYKVTFTKDELAYLIESIKRNTYAVDIDYPDQKKRKYTHEKIEHKFIKLAPEECYDPSYFD